MIYRRTTYYEATETTCGEMVKRLEESGGNVWCYFGDRFILSEGGNPSHVRLSWDWIQAQKPNRKLILLVETSDTGEMLAI